MVHDTQKSGLELDDYWKRPSVKGAIKGPFSDGVSQLKNEASRTAYKGLKEKRRNFLLYLHKKFYDSRFERLLFVSSEGKKRDVAFDLSGTQNEVPEKQEQVPVKVVEWAMRVLPRAPHGMYFVDFNSGRGQRLLIASSMEFERVIGSETCEVLCDDAQMNISQFPRSLMGCRLVECICAPARKIAIPDKNAAFMFYQPRGLADFRLQVDRIVNAYRASPRRFVLLTVDAEYQHHELIMNSGVFEVQKYPQIARLKHALLSPYKIRAYRTIV